ncbi:hypothetical protein [Acidovorax soli]|uniref:hypothetical protein n=1 Tax=Acidovorax soli TaxID=592050 RepID=UPI001C881589|nr:hypothetical protein [Acidovorax soli]
MAWQGLTADEKANVQQKYVVEVMAPESFGTIIDNQGLDRSTPGSNAGTAMGAAIGSTAYVDRAINHGNYSGKTHVAAMLLGMLVGSALDRPAQSSYQFRYAIRLGNGNVIYQDTYSSTPFRHAVGVCVFTPSIDLAPEQHLCTQTTDTFKNSLGIFNVPTALNAPAGDRLSSPETPPTLQATETASETVSCKLGTLAPVKTSPEKCKLINGAIIND